MLLRLKSTAMDGQLGTPKEEVKGVTWWDYL
jgi:hypothetical protein